jgi:uncharacterized protein
VFKAHVQVGDYDPTDPQLRDVWGLIEDAQTPVVIHCGSGPAPGTHTGPEPISHLLREHPRLPLIIAHMGMPEYSDFLDLAERYPHVRLDTTMAFTDFTEATMPGVPPSFRTADRIVSASERNRGNGRKIREIQARVS